MSRLCTLRLHPLHLRVPSYPLLPSQIVDRSRNNQRVFESASILMHLIKHYDTEYKLHFEDDVNETEMVRSPFPLLAKDESSRRRFPL